jgi:hypothetical protein
VNYLTLAQKLRRKCRVMGSGPTAVTGQSEEYSRLLDWISEAWMEIQRMRNDWAFQRATATCATVLGQTSYSASDFGISDTLGFWAVDYENGDTFRNYVTATGTSSETFMDVWDYDRWRDTYLFGALRTSYTRPYVVAVTPDNAIACGPIADAGYTLVGDYYKVPTELVAATDTPTLPVQYHMAIVYKAMMYYGASEAAPEVYDEGRGQFEVIIRQIMATQLRRPRLPGALA